MKGLLSYISMAVLTSFVAHQTKKTLFYLPCSIFFFIFLFLPQSATEEPLFTTPFMKHGRLTLLRYQFSSD